MLIKFKTRNYLSFKDEVSFTMEPAAIKELEEDNIAEVSVGELSVLKSLVIYGANASGKSNLLKALAFMRNFVLGSAKDKQANEDIEVENFRLSTATENQSSIFEIEILQQAVIYRYGFAVTKRRVHQEWLLFRKKRKEYPIFSRLEDSFDIHEKFSELHHLTSRTRTNALFLSVLSLFNNQTAIDIIRWFQNVVYIPGTYGSEFFSGHTTALFENSAHRAQLLKLIKGADLGFDEVYVEKLRLTPDMLSELGDDVKRLLLLGNEGRTVVKTKHYKYDDEHRIVGEVYFNLNSNESLGTQKYFAMMGPILDALVNSKVIIIDELDARLHPALSYWVICLFNSRVNNPRNAQLIVTTHNSNLMSRNIFRRDQILFTKKDAYGATRLSLLLGAKVRNDASYEKDYLSGKYQAIPNTAVSYSNQLSLFED